MKKLIQGKKRGSKQESIRPFVYFIYYRMSGYEFLAWLLGGLLLIAYLLTYIQEFDISYLQVIMNDVLNKIHKHEGGIKALSYSYFTGLFIYFLTVTIPSGRRGQIFLPFLCDKLRRAIDEFSELSYFFTGQFEWDRPSDFLVNAVKNTITHAENKDKSYYTLKPFLNELTSFRNNVIGYLDEVFTYEVALSSKELKCILNVRHSNLFEQIKDKEYMERYFIKESLTMFFSDVILLHEDLKNIYLSIHNRAYKRN